MSNHPGLPVISILRFPVKDSIIQIQNMRNVLIEIANAIEESTVQALRAWSQTELGVNSTRPDLRGVTYLSMLGMLFLLLRPLTLPRAL